MAATADIILPDYSATSKTFTPSIALKGGFQYNDTSSTVASPRTLQVKHTMLAPNVSNGTDVHSISFGHTVLDSVGKPYTVVAGLTFRVPRAGPSIGNRRDLWTFIKNFLTDANVEKLLIGGF